MALGPATGLCDLWRLSLSPAAGPPARPVGSAWGTSASSISTAMKVPFAMRLFKVSAHDFQESLV